jgi:AmmeMemoRadiSam system protein B
MSIGSAYLMPHPPIILPEVGHGGEAALAETTAAFGGAARRIAAQAPETIVVVSPHGPVYRDYFHVSPAKRLTGDMGRFGAGGVRISRECDTEYARSLSALAEEQGFPAGMLGEDGPMDHGTLIPLYFTDRAYRGYRLLRVGFSGLSPISHYRFGELIAQTAARLGRNTVFIASGDLSHKLREDGPYGFAAEGPEFDKQIAEALRANDYDRFLGFAPSFSGAAAECGLRSLQILAGVVGEGPAKTELLSYEGPFGVGYAVAAVSFSP